MVKLHRRTKITNNYQSTTGDVLKLDIERKNKSINITVYNLSKTANTKQCIMLLVVVILNWILLVFKVLNILLAAAVFVVTLVYLYRMCRIVREENLVIVKDLGMQLTKKYTLGFKTTFIPQDTVQRFFINEIIFRNNVIYVLTLFTKELNEDRLIPLFFDTKPRMPCLEAIYRSIKELDK